MSVLPLKPGNYRLLCFDLDGTLLTSHKEILPSSLEALDKAVKAGYIIAFATGRPPEGLLRYAECFSFSIRQCYAVCYNGSATVRLQDLSNVVAHVMDGTQVKEIGALAHVCHTAIHGYCSEKGLLLEEENPHALKEGRHSGVPHRLMDTQTLDDEVHFYKCIATGEAENLDALRASLPQSLLEKVSVMRSERNYLEFIAGKCTKGSALTELAASLGIPMERTMAFGDAENDQAMLKMAGCGVCMGNGTEATKALADVVTGTNDEGGIAAIVSQLV